MLSPWRAALATSTAIAAAVFLWPGGWLFPFSFDTALAVAALTWALALAAEPASARADLAAGVCLLAALLCPARDRPRRRHRPRRRRAPIAPAAGGRSAPRPLAAAAAGYALLSAGIPRDRLVAGRLAAR